MKVGMVTKWFEKVKVKWEMWKMVMSEDGFESIKYASKTEIKEVAIKSSFHM